MAVSLPGTKRCQRYRPIIPRAQALGSDIRDAERGTARGDRAAGKPAVSGPSSEARRAMTVTAITMAAPLRRFTARIDSQAFPPIGAATPSNQMGAGSQTMPEGKKGPFAQKTAHMARETSAQARRGRPERLTQRSTPAPNTATVKPWRAALRHRLDRIAPQAPYTLRSMSSAPWRPGLFCRAGQPQRGLEAACWRALLPPAA